MAEASIDILSCPICLEQYQTPRSLPCLHTFCEECLGSYIFYRVENDAIFPCPICKKAVTVTSPGNQSDVRLWAQGFPENHLIMSLMERHNLTEKKCTSCVVGDNTSSLAIYWCHECRDGFCEKCYAYHQKNRVTMKHKSGPVGELSSSPSFDMNEDCPRHHGKTIEVYCVDHSELCCVICFATNHRECKQIHSIDDISATFDVRKKCTDIPVVLKEVQCCINKMALSKDTNVEQVSEEEKVITVEITGLVEKTKQKLDFLQESLINDLNLKYKTEKEYLKQRKKLILAFEKHLLNCCRIMESAGTATARQAFVAYEKLKMQLFSHYDQLKIELDKDADIHLTLHENTALKDALKSIESIGTIEVQKKRSDDTSASMELVNRQLNNIYSTSVEKLKALDLMEATVSLVRVVTRGDLRLGNVDYANGTFLRDGRLLFTDFSKGSNRLILFDKQFGFVKSLPVDGQPTDVAAGQDDNDIFVCLRTSGIIQYNLTHNLTLVKKRSFSYKAWCLAVFSHFMILGMDYEDCIIRAPLEGNETSEIMLSTNCRKIGKSEKLQRYYHLDGSSVICRKLDGEEVFRHQMHVEKETGFSISVDTEGNAYVGCQMSGKRGQLLQISNDGKQSRVLVESLNSIIDPYAVIFHSTRNLFVVGSNNEDTLMEIYEFVP